VTRKTPKARINELSSVQRIALEHILLVISDCDTFVESKAASSEVVVRSCSMAS
jgi:hypothetical protein